MKQYERETMDADILHNVSRLINRTARALNRNGEPRLKPLGFAMGQIPVLALLKDGSTRSQKELAEFANIEQPSMAQMLSRMERDALITRTPDPKDGRRSLIALTPSTIERLPSARKILIDQNRQAVAGLTEKDVATLTRLLEHVLGNLELQSD